MDKLWSFVPLFALLEPEGRHTGYHLCVVDRQSSTVEFESEDLLWKICFAAFV